MATNLTLFGATSGIPAELQLDDFKKLITVITSSNICAGHSEKRFVEMANSIHKVKRLFVSFLDIVSQWEMSHTL
jgi:hypothetical protein